MFIPILLSCVCWWPYQELKNEIDVQIFVLSQKIEEFDEDKKSYDFGYLNGKLDVYRSLQDGMNQKPPTIQKIIFDTNN